MNNERCVMTKRDDKQARIMLSPGTKGACCLEGRTIPEQGGRITADTACPLEDEIWRDIAKPTNDKGENMRSNHSVPKSMDINKLHDALGHKGEGLLRKTCKHLGTKATGELKACEARGLAKAKQKSLSKTTSNEATKPGERSFFDTAGPFAPTVSGSTLTFCITDDHSRFSWVCFGKTKGQIGQHAKALVTQLKAEGCDTKCLRCDPGGENQPLEVFCKERGITQEITAANAPQQNGVAERKLTAMIQRAHAQMRACNFDENARELLWAESVNTANNVENMSSNTQRSARHNR
jgi:hypothetical protein